MPLLLHVDTSDTDRFWSGREGPKLDFEEYYLVLVVYMRWGNWVGVYTV